MRTILLSFIFPLLLYFLLSMFIYLFKNSVVVCFLLHFKIIFHFLRNKYLTFKDFCIAYHILLSAVCKYNLTHMRDIRRGIYFIYISLERLSYSTSAHVCYIKIQAEMTDILQVKDCSFYIHWCPCVFICFFHILSLSIHII